MSNMDRCPKCLLPANYPGIRIENGACNYCKKYSKPIVDYKGEKRLLEDIGAILAKYPDRNTEYDVAVGFSGGMDSTWLLYYATRQLNLRVLAVTMRHKFMPKHTYENIENIAKLLNVPVVYFDNPYLDEYAAYFIKNWAYHPTVQGLIGFCTGCRYGLSKLLYQEVAKRNIHILLSGLNQYESTEYRVHSVMLNPNKPSKLGFALGYGKELAANPHYLASPGKIAFQLKEHMSFKELAKMRRASKKNAAEALDYLGITEIYPFYSYINWNRKEATDVLEKLGWQKGSDAQQEWRSDCEVGLIRQYYYRRLLGFNDQEVKRAHMLRNHQLTVDDPGKIEETDPSVIRRILKDSFDLDFDEIEQRIERLNS